MPFVTFPMLHPLMDPYESKKWIDRGMGFSIAALTLCAGPLLFFFMLSLDWIYFELPQSIVDPSYAAFLTQGEHTDSDLPWRLYKLFGTNAPIPSSIFVIIITCIEYYLPVFPLAISFVSAIAFLCNYQSKGKKADWIVGMISSLLTLQLIPAILFVLAGISRKKGFTG